MWLWWGGLWALVLTAAPALADVSLWVRDGAGEVRPANGARASLQRTPPRAAPDDRGARHGDPDALQLLVGGDGDELPSHLWLRSYDGGGRLLDQLPRLSLLSVACPEPVKAKHCAASLPVRAALDAVDADHPLSRTRSLLARLGGQLRVSADGVELARIDVLGPRKTPAGAMDRLSARVRLVAVRLAPRGAPPLGAHERQLRAVLAAAMQRVNALWGACGIGFGPPNMSMALVDPPPSHLLSLGCGHGLPAYGGKLRLRVAGQPLTVALPRGSSPRRVSRLVARALRKMGFVAVLSDNPPAAGSAMGSTDISVRNKSGRLQVLQPPRVGPLVSDRSFTACIGSVNLEDGLQHFYDTNATVGTLEERTLLKAYDDGDPRTIDVFVIPVFGGGARIGESFIGADGSPLRNIVIIDRVAILSDGAAFTLAHELGHVLLDSPGHPDDYGRDLPTRLMDADAADRSAFGPRRLSLGECARALRQSGPRAPIPLLQPDGG